MTEPEITELPAPKSYAPKVVTWTFIAGVILAVAVASVVIGMDRDGERPRANAGSGTGSSTGNSRPAPVASASDLLLKAVRGKSPQAWAPYSDAEVVRAGEDVCTSLDTASDRPLRVLALITTAANSDDPPAASYMVGSAIALLCPEFSSDFKAASNTYG